MPQALTHEPLLKFPDKSPNARLDYSFRFADWLVEDDYVVNAAVSPVEGLTVQGSVISVDPESDVDGASMVTFWASGGTLETAYPIPCRIETAQGRIEERIGLLRVVSR